MGYLILQMVPCGFNPARSRNLLTKKRRTTGHKWSCWTDSKSKKLCRKAARLKEAQGKSMFRISRWCEKWWSTLLWMIRERKGACQTAVCTCSQCDRLFLCADCSIICSASINAVAVSIAIRFALIFHRDHLWKARARALRMQRLPWGIQVRFEKKIHIKFNKK